MGGVISGLGKGLITASIGRILKEGGYQVFITKCDPYLNVDPGTIHPIEHGEVFVTADGAETDLDLGHYERFVDFETNHFSNITSGNIYRNIIKKERKGVYQGQTIQMNPHVIDYIKNFLSNINAEADFILVEIGGVVGDIESLPFIEAIRQLRLELGSSQVMIVMIGFLVNLKHVGELKTKPFQTSVRRFLELGIPPDLVIVRSEISPSQELLAKLSLYCGLNQKNIFIAQDQK